MRKSTKSKNHLSFPRVLQAAALGTKVATTSTRLTKKVDRYVTKNPYRTMGVIALAGLCVGYLAHR